MTKVFSDELDILVIEVLSDYLAPCQWRVEMSSRLVEDLCVDSVGLVEIVMCLNQTFNIDLPEAEVAEWNTVEDICYLVRFCRGL